MRYVALIVMSATATARAETVTTLALDRCFVAGVIGEDVIIDGEQAGVYAVPKAGGKAEQLFAPTDNARWDYRVHGNHIVYVREEPMDNNTWHRDDIGIIDRKTKQATKLVEPNKIWAITADDKFIYVADVGAAVGSDEGSEIYKAPLAGGDKTVVSLVPGRVGQLRAYKGTVFATTHTTKPDPKGRAPYLCREVHRASGARSKRLDKTKCPPAYVERGEIGGLTVSATGIYYARGDAARKLPFAGGKETILGDADTAHHMPRTSGATFVWQHEKVFFVADTTKQKLAPKQLPFPGEWHATYAFSGDDVFWTEYAGKQCKILRATAK